MSGYTQAQLDALRAAVARGVKTVSYDGNSVTYQSVDDMLKLIATIERSLNPSRTRIQYPAFDRGTR